MELVLDKEMWGEFINCYYPKPKTEKQQKLQFAIENENNKIKLSSNYNQIIEQYFKDLSSYDLSTYQSFMICLSDNDRLSTFISKEKKEEDEELKEIYNYELNDYTFVLKKNKTTLLKSEPSIKNNISIFDNIKKPNIDWLILSVATCNVISLTYSDFKNQSELNDLIKLCSKLSKQEKNIYIIDSYFNLNQSSLLNNFIGCGLKYKCYTSSINKKESEKRATRSSIKSYFGKRQTSVLFSKNKAILHDRQIMVGSFIIESTHDFSEILIKNNNWHLYFKICDIEKSNIKNKLTMYN